MQLMKIFHVKSLIANFHSTHEYMTHQMWVRENIKVPFIPAVYVYCALKLFICTSKCTKSNFVEEKSTARRIKDDLYVENYIRDKVYLRYFYCALYFMSRCDVIRCALGDHNSDFLWHFLGKHYFTI